jgi:hypothetical protein
MNIKFPAGISLFICLFCTSVFAEQLQVDSVYTDKKDEVLSIITFLPALPEGIEKLEKSDFQLLIGANKVLQADKIEPFYDADRGFDLLFCVDVSGSISKVLPAIQGALIDLFKPPFRKDKDRFAIVSFADKVTPVPEFTNDKEVLKHQIFDKLKRQGTKTVLYSAVFDSLNRLDKLNKDNQPRRYQRILVISDGKDEGSDKRVEDVIDLSRRYGIPIDAVAQGVIPKQYSESLGWLADATGGQFKRNEAYLKNAIIEIYKDFQANSWAVYFKYPQADPEKLENAVIKFQQNDRSWSATLSRGIPMPKVEGPPSTTDSIFEVVVTKLKIYWEKWKDKLLYFALLGLYFALGLISVFLLFVFWKSRQNKNDPETVPGVDTDIIKKQVEPGSQQLKWSKPRQTEVSGTFKPTQQGHQTNLALIVLEGPLKGRTIPVNKQLFRVGADPDNDLVLIDDDYISGSHALLRYDNGELLLSDQHSLNGTLLNSALVADKASIVVPGDVIQIGKSSLKLIET